jgi:influenza virus NS1A-binding protein
LFRFFSSGRFQAAVTSFQGKIWAVGGCDGWNPLNSVEVYDPTTNTWKVGPPLTTPRRGCGLAVRNGNLPSWFFNSRDL